MGIVVRRSTEAHPAYAEVLSTAVNQDGRTANLNAPNPAAQVNHATPSPVSASSGMVGQNRLNLPSATGCA